MGKMIKVNFRNLVTEEFEAETSFLEVSKAFKSYFNYPILAVKVDNDICDLSEPLNKKCDIDFFDRSSSVGNSIYSRGLQFILILAVKRLFDNMANVIIEHSMDKGFYFEIEGVPVDESIVPKLEKEMKKIVKEDLHFTKLSVARLDAIKFFKKKNMMDKVKVLKYISNTYINLYRIDDVYDYFYGEMPYSTKSVDEFKLTYIKDNGLVLSYPDIYNPEITLDYKHREKLFDAFLDYTKWGRKLKISNAADLNERVSTGKYDEIIRIDEINYNNQLAQVALEIKEKQDDIKLVLIAGPSSSGKTTTSRKLQSYLKCEGISTYSISIDDYFLNREDTPLDKNGEPDYESTRALDISLFNKNLLSLIAGEPTDLPTYNFATGKREYNKLGVKLEENQIIIIEGLHALNDELTMSIERKNKYHIYICPLTQLNVDNHNRIFTSDTRKLRRIVRDNKYRGHNAEDTLLQWKNIREGEEKYIFPYQEDVDKVINSALIYELGVLKTYAEPLLFSVDETSKVYPEALRLINFLRNFLPIPSEGVPADSVLREFIGGSVFQDK